MSQTTSVVKVTWLDLPTDILLGNLRHLEDLVHELRLLREGGRSGVVQVPSDLAATISDILDSYQGPHREVWSQVLEAADAGAERLDVSVLLPPESVEASRRLLALLDGADALCRQGILMTLPVSDEIAGIRRWMCDEMERQIAGRAEPAPYAR